MSASHVDWPHGTEMVIQGELTGRIGTAAVFFESHGHPAWILHPAPIKK
jgi:hypothetical protein